MVTGNYNFFNILTCALCLAILNDSHVTEEDEPTTRVVQNGSTHIEDEQDRDIVTTVTAGTSWVPRWAKRTFDSIVAWFFFGGLTYYTIKYFSLEVDLSSGFSIKSR